MAITALRAVGSRAMAQGPAPEMTGEELLFMDIPVVVTASRKAQLITEAPASVSIITAEDIKASGMRTIPDILRMVPGLDVMTITSNNQQVSMRGFIDVINNRVLVLINGRSIYWEAAPLRWRKSTGLKLSGPQLVPLWGQCLLRHDQHNH
jgi:iron complex outermembrane receptor protein